MAAPHGVRGWLNVAPFTEAPEAMLQYRAWRMTRRGEREASEFRVLEGRAHGDALVVKVAGIDTREQAALLRGSLVEVPREALPQVGDDEVYLADLPGCTVVNEGGVTLGVVEAVDEFGAQPLLRVVGDGHARLIPLVPAYVKSVDLAARVIEVEWAADY